MDNKIPQPPDGVIDLDTAVEALIAAIPEHHREIMKSMDEEEILSGYHMSGGMALRNEWCLWWHDSAPAVKDGKWPKEKPALIKWFNDRGIVHADDISNVIATSTVRKIKGVDIDFEGQTKQYFDHWKENGFEDGIFKYE